MSISRGCIERIGLSENKPVVLLLQKHKEYTDHYVLGVGYAVYRYSDESESQYIRIIDGWTSNSSRYVTIRRDIKTAAKSI